MDMQNVSNLTIPEGEVKAIHNSSNQLLWGRVNYDTKYAGDTLQNGTPTPDVPIPIQVVTGEQVISITDGTNTQNFTVSLGSIELAKIGTYQDYIYKSGEDWYVHKATGKAVLDGSETFVIYPYGTNSYATTISGMTNTPTDTQLVASDYLYGVAYNDRAQAIQNMIYTDGGQIGQLDIRNTNWTTATDLTNWLSTHNATIYYALATPTDTKITDSTLISQLNAVHQWLVRYGYNATVTGNLPIIIDRTNL